MRKSKLLVFFCLVGLKHAYAEMRDPTQPPAIPISVTQETPQYEGDYKLQSILIGPMRKLAMINGELVSVGSKIQNARVVAINKNYVVLLIGGRQMTLYLFGKRLWKAH